MLFIIRPTPRSTLFPYTTLFRSSLQDVRLTEVHVQVAHREETHTVSLDRKSTRLNSSHTVISYAVFCLKKKKPRLFFTPTFGNYVAVQECVDYIEFDRTIILVSD